MKKIMILLFSVLPLLVMANTHTACNAPTIKNVKLEPKLTGAVSSEKQTLYFGNKYFIKMSQPNNVLIGSIVAYLYPNSDKNISFHSHADIDATNREQFLLAFGLKEGELSPEIYNLRKIYQLCDGHNITQYHISDMSSTVVGLHSMIDGKTNTMVYIFNDIEADVWLVQFIGFSEEEVNNTLATLRTIVRS